MAKVEKTEREKRWERTIDEFNKTKNDPDNAGSTKTAMYRAVGKKMKLSPVTVRKIIERNNGGAN